MAQWLAEADASLRAGEAKTALRTLLSAWRDLRHPAIADTIGALSVHVVSSVPPLAGKRPSDKLEAWKTRADEGDPADFGLLAQHLFLVNSGREVGDHLERLGRWPPDPRLSSLLHELALSVPFTSSSAKPFWRALFAVLPKIGDPRTLEVLDAIDAKHAATFDGRDDYLPYLPNQTKKIRAALRGVTSRPLDDATLSSLETMRALVAEKAKPTRSAAQIGSLLDAVYAEPTSDAPRQVLADALLESGDPRGDFLVLQLAGRELSREEKRREKDLVEEHAAEWLGPLAGWIRKGDRVFRRGFLARCTIEQKGRNAGPFPEIAAWSTVEEATAVQPLGTSAFRCMRGARSLCGVAASALVDASTMPHLAEVLAIGEYARGLFDLDLAALPSLRRLRFVFRGLAGTPRPDVTALVSAFRRLEQLTWFRTEIGSGPEGTRLGHISEGIDLALARENQAVTAHVRIHVEGDTVPAHLEVLSRLARQAPFVQRTKVVAWNYRDYMRGLDPATELAARLPIDRVRETRLPGVEIAYRGLSGEEAFEERHATI